MFRHSFSTLGLILSILGFIYSTVHAQTATGSPPAAGIDLFLIDTTVSPCEDFYQFANGAWLKSAAIPADRPSWGTGSQLNERNLNLIHTILDEVASDQTSAQGTIRQKVGTYYRSGMDSAGIELAGIKPLQPEYGRIAAIESGRDLINEIARLHRRNISPAFGFFVYMDFKNASKNIAQVYQGGLAMPNMEYYTKTDDQSEKVKKSYVEHVSAMFQLLGDPSTTAADEAATVMRLETRLATASMRPVEERDPNGIYHKLRAADLDTLAPHIPWSDYFTTVGLPGCDEVNVAQPAFLKEVDRMVESVPLQDWKTYLRWQLTNAEAPRLASAFVSEDFRFNNTTLRGMKELRVRWKRILQETDDALGEALGQLFVEKTFSPAAKERAHGLVLNLQSALRNRLEHLDWISESTRKQALLKLNALTIKVGYPDHWRDYSPLRLDGSSFVDNAMQAAEFEFQRNLNKIGKPLDRAEWSMTPSTVNAYYNPNYNEIVFPAGILQPPFFDMGADDAVIYGGIGTIIGHELTHGYDDQGRQFDAEGNLRDWWTKQDGENYTSRASIVEQQYNGYLAVDTMHVNGKLTMGENIADQGGLKIAYLAFRKTLEGKPEPQMMDGFTADQRFFLAFAQAWKRLTRPESVRLMILGDPHSPPRFRVTGSIVVNPDFARAFHCTSGAMINGNGGAASIW